MYLYSLKEGGELKGKSLRRGGGGHVPLVPPAYGPMQDTLRLEELATTIAHAVTSKLP